MEKIRRYDIDALRALAFFCLILYHVGMFYVADWDWHIKSAYTSAWLKFPMILINPWRMPLLFLISGIASSLLLRNLDATTFLKKRLFRLGLPFLVGVLVVVPPQAYLQALANGSLENTFGALSYSEFLWRYFTFQVWPQGAFDGSDYRFTWNHLWFVPYLMVYTLLLMPLKKLSWFVWLGTGFAKMGPMCLIVLPVLLQIVYQLVLNDEQGITHTLIADSYGHAVFFTFFILGYWISDRAETWSIIVKLRWLTLGLALCTYVAVVLLGRLFYQQEWQDHLAGVTETFNQWLWLLTVLGWAATLLNRPAAWVRYANDRVYPWYILHQTLIILVGYQLTPLALGGLVESTLVLITTVTTGFMLTHFVIERSKLLCLAFGLRVRTENR